MKIDKANIHLVLSKIIEIRDLRKENPSDMYVLGIHEFNLYGVNEFALTIFYKLVDYGAACWVVVGKSIDYFNYDRVRDFVMRYLDEEVKIFMSQFFEQDFENIESFTKSTLPSIRDILCDLKLVGVYGLPMYKAPTSYAKFLFAEKEADVPMINLPPETNFSSPPIPPFPDNKHFRIPGGDF